MSSAFRQTLWASATLIAAAALASAGAPPKARAKPKQALTMGDLWYVLYVPEGYDAKAAFSYPLILVAQARDDQADAAFRAWEGFAKQDRVFLAALNFPPGSKENRAARTVQLAQELCKKYERISERQLALLGVEGGASAVVRTVADYPRAFALAVAVGPRDAPDLSKEKPNREPDFAPSATRLHVTYDPKDAKLRDPLANALEHLNRLGVSVRPKGIEAAAAARPTEEEAKLAQEAIRGLYSDGKRAEVAARRREAAEAARKKQEEEDKKVAAAKAKEAEAVKKAKEAADPEKDPDTLLDAAEKARTRRDFPKALDLYRKVARLRPDSDFARVANQALAQLEADPLVKQMLADSVVAGKARPLLQAARNWQRTGDLGKAGAHFRKVVQQFPGTSFAAEAQRELDALETQ